MEKKQLRKEIQATLKQILSLNSSYSIQSSKITNLLYKNPDWINARFIGITLSNFPEADTYDVIKEAWRTGKKVAVPKCYPAEKALEFREIVNFDSLESIFYGLKEPIVTETKVVPDGKIDLLFVPGLAFSRDGYRLGFGGGYYDRFLTRFSGKTVSLAFDIQILSTVPKEKHDMPVSKIITPSEVIQCD